MTGTERLRVTRERAPARRSADPEPRTLQLFRLVYQAPGHVIGTREACSVLDWSPKLLSATASELDRHRGGAHRAMTGLGYAAEIGLSRRASAEG